MFILLGRDPLAPVLVGVWATMRRLHGEDPRKVEEALDCAEAMSEWLTAMGKTVAKIDITLNIPGSLKTITLELGWSKKGMPELRPPPLEYSAIFQDRCARLLQRDSEEPISPTVDVFPLVEIYYAKPGNEAGGSLHIVLDDGNEEDGAVDFCIGWALERRDWDGVALGSVLRRMPESERAKIRKSPS